MTVQIDDRQFIQSRQDRPRQERREEEKNRESRSININMYSNEFFIQRSFEVVWAVFRIAEHATRLKVQQGLEDKALDYLLAKDMKSLDGLEEIVRFGAQIRDIGQVNANVLLREIGTLRVAMLELADTQRKQLAPVKTPESAPQIEEVFAKPPMRVADLLEAIRKGMGEDKKEVSEDKTNDIASRKITTDGQASESGKSPASEINSPASIANSPALLRPDRPGLQTGAAIDKSRFEAAIGFKERNDIIMQILTKRSLCHMKDLMGVLPNVSERTVRYDVQRLVDKGVIERVGTGGPNSFFRMKRESDVKISER